MQKAFYDENTDLSPLGIWELCCFIPWASPGKSVKGHEVNQCRIWLHEKTVISREPSSPNQLSGTNHLTKLNHREGNSDNERGNCFCSSVTNSTLTVALRPSGLARRYSLSHSGLFTLHISPCRMTNSFYFACAYLSLLERSWSGIIFRLVFPMPALLLLLVLLYLWLRCLTWGVLSKALLFVLLQSENWSLTSN